MAILRLGSLTVFCFLLGRRLADKLRALTRSDLLSSNFLSKSLAFIGSRLVFSELRTKNSHKWRAVFLA